MTDRRHFLQSAFALGALQGLAVSPAGARAFAAFLEQGGAQEINPDHDAEAYDFWSGFLGKDANPVVAHKGRERGAPQQPAGSELQPYFLHYGPEGFKNAAELDASGLISEGDVNVSLNTSTIRISPQDQETFNHLQNAQIRLDVAQKNGILPELEAMAYTLVSGMLSSNGGTSHSPKAASSEGKGKSSGSKSSGGKSGSGSIQSIAVDSDAAWQKMQNVILPGGEGRWALNLEAQKKDSFMYKFLRTVMSNVGQFAPVVGLPGIAVSALQSFNVLYGAMHAQPVAIIKSNPMRMFATKQALQGTGAPGAVTGIMLKSGTYILIPAKQLPDPSQLKDLTVMQGRIVPPKTSIDELDSAALDTLKETTYVTFDVEARPSRLFRGPEPQKAG